MKVYKDAINGIHYLWNGRCWFYWAGGSWGKSWLGRDYKAGLLVMSQLIGNNYRQK